MSKSQEEPARLQDFVIDDGKLVGDFEGLYAAIDDPWDQSLHTEVRDTRRHLAVHWMRRLRADFSASRVIELGCGFGYLTEALRADDFAALGVDVSIHAVQQARARNPSGMYVQGTFADFEFLAKFDPDVFLMAEITWYVLDHLDEFVLRLKAFGAGRSRPTFLIHLLTTYPPGEQKYGADKFTNLEEILEYFNLGVIEAGLIRTPRPGCPDAQGTYFIARVSP